MMAPLALLAASAVGAEAPESGWSVDRLLALLHAGRQAEVRFEEATYSSLLTEPLRVKGVLRFAPPDTMEKEIREPARERYLVEGDRVVIEKGNVARRTLSLREYPALRSLVEAFRGSFTGDAGRLRGVYETTLGGDRSQWTLLLRPRDTEAKTMVDYILFTGHDGRIKTIAIREPDGDRTVMTILHGPGP